LGGNLNEEMMEIKLQLASQIKPFLSCPKLHKFINGRLLVKIILKVIGFVFVKDDLHMHITKSRETYIHVKYPMANAIKEQLCYLF
jgi:hypothetical protein